MHLTRTVKKNYRSNSAQFFVNFLVVVLHYYNVKRPETSWFSRFMEEVWYIFLFTFSTAAHLF